MTVTITPFLFASLATLVLWVGVLLWPIERSYGHFDFGGAFDSLVHFIVGVFGTLAIWLVYFAAKSWGWF